MKRLLPLPFALAALTGCAGLTPSGALQTAHDAAKVACTLLQGQTSGDVLAALSALQKDVTVALAGAAAGKVEPDQIASLLRSLAALAEAQRALAAQLVAMAGEAPVRLQPCAAEAVPVVPAPVIQ